MILDFHLDNCRVFTGDSTTLSLHTETKAENSMYALHKAGNLLISKYTCIYGASGSGKSVLLDSIYAMASFASAEDNVVTNVLVPHFAHKDKPTTATLTFLHKDRKHEYSLTVENGSITKESLRIQKTRKFSTVCKAEGEIAESCVYKAFKQGNQDVVDAFSYFNRITFSTASTKCPHVPECLITNTFEAQPLALELMSKLFKSSDLGVDSIAIKDKKFVGKVAYGSDPVCYADMTLDELGSGAQQLFKVALRIIPVLVNGGVAVVDNFDDSLHPLLAEHVLELFKHDFTNPHNAQLICAMRAAGCMNRLLKQQIVFCNHNKGSISEIYALNDFQGVRKDDNYSAKYLAGAYGAIPDCN